MMYDGFASLNNATSGAARANSFLFPGGGGGGGYQDALGRAQQQYQGVLSGYQSALAGQQAQQAQVTAGYGNLKNETLGRLAGGQQAERIRAQRQFAQESGKATQGLISAGLGNTTVTSSVQRGINSDYALANADIGAKWANLYAGYGSQIGLAGLGYQGQAIGQNAAMLGQQLGFQGQYAGMQQQYANQLGLGNQNYQNQLGLLSNGYGRGGGGGGGGRMPQGQQPFQPEPEGYGMSLDQLNTFLGGSGGYGE